MVCDVRPYVLLLLRLTEIVRYIEYVYKVPTCDYLH